mgnify:CR=1 FL=1
MDINHCQFNRHPEVPETENIGHLRAGFALDCQGRRRPLAKDMLVSGSMPLIPGTSPAKTCVAHVDASEYAVDPALLQDQGHELQPCGYFCMKSTPVCMQGRHVLP